MDKKKLMKVLLEHMVEAFATINTDKAELIVDGDPEIGKAVYIDSEDGMAAPEDGVYSTDKIKITVSNGVISEIENVEETPAEETPETPAEQQNNAEETPDVDSLNARISELEDQLAQRDNTINDLNAQIEALNARIAELEDKTNAPVEDPIKMNKVFRDAQEKENKALKYFNN